MNMQQILGELMGRAGTGAGQRPGSASAGGLGGLLAGLGGGQGSASGGLLGGLLGGGGGAGGGLGDILGRMRPPMGGAAGAAAAGGLLGSLFGGRGGGGLLRTGGMAVVGLLAHRAYEQWKTQQAGGTAQAPAADAFAQAEAQGGGDQPFGLALVRAMVAAGRADGELDAEERNRIFSETERLQLDAEDKAEVFRILDTQPDPQAIARLAVTEAQKAELYTASALIIGQPGVAERVYLEALAGALRLPPGLRTRLDAQVIEAMALPPG